MKRNLILSMLALAGSLSAGPVDDAVALLQSRKYPEAAAALAGVPLEARGPGEVAYLRALSLHLAGKSDEAVAAAGQVPGDSAWGMKARFLTAAAHTKAKRHKEAEAIYAAAAAEAFDPARRDGLVQSLLEFAGEAINPVAAGELTPPKPDWKKAAVLYDKVLDLPVTAELRSEVLLRKARLHAVAGDEAATEGTFNAWLLFSDPGWTLPLGAGKQNVEAKVTGKARAEARLRLAGSLVAQRRVVEARMVADDLLALLAGLPEGDPDKAMAGDARWLKVRTYSEEMMAQVRPMQQRGQAVQGDQGEAGPLGSPHQQFVTMVPFPRRAEVVTYVPDEYLAALRGFLKDFPGHGSAPLAAEAVARTLDRLDRDVEAVAAWGDFIGAKVYQFDGAAAASRVPDRVTGVTPAEDLLRRQQAGAFRVGQRHFEKRRYAEAIAQWQGYIAAYPNGAEWPRAQSGIVDAEFQSGLEAVASGDEKRARELFDAFLVRYPLEARARQILFIYGQFRYAAAQAMKEQKHPETAAEFQKAIEEWTRLTGKYPETEEASLALYNTALILSDELGRLEDGLAAFKRLTWGKWADPAKRRVDLMSSKSLAVASERVFRLSETPAVKISVRNIEKVKVSRYPLDVEAFFRSRHRMDAIDLLDIDLIAPEKTWEVAVQDYARYRSLQQDIPVEFAAGQSGACIVRVEAEDWQATTLVVRSDIDVVVETARREVLAFVTSGADKKPVSGAAVLLSDGGKVMASGQTGADGVFRAKPEGIEKAETVRVLVSSAQGMAGSYLSMSGLGLSTAADKMSRVVFDRGAYGAGGVVQWVAMRREVREGAFPVMAAGEGWKWRAQLPDGRLLYEGAAVWDELGLCRGSFTLPPSAFDGEYKVRIFNEKESVQGGFTVAAEAARAALGIRGVMERPRYLAGETAKGYFVLEWANGLPAASEGVVLELPGGKTENRTSDANGVVAFEYPAAVAGEYAVVLRPTGRQALPGRDDGGLAGMARFSVRADEFGLAFGVMPEVVLAGEAFEMKLRARRYDERGWAGTVKLTVARRGAVVPSRVLEGVPWISAPVREAKDEVVLDGEVVIGESGDAAQALALPQPGNYVLKLSGKDRQGHEIMVETMLRAVGGEEDAVLRVLGPAEPLVAGQVLKLRIQSGFAHPNALVTVHAQEFFSHQLVALKVGANELEIPVLAVHAPNFRVTVAAVDGRQVHVASRPFEVRSGLRLELADDGNGYVVRTTDLAGRPVAAAVVAHAWASGGAGGLTAMPRVVVPTRATGLSLDSSVAFFHTGITVQKTADKVVLTDNNIRQLFAIQQTELSFNTSNTALVALNETFATGNGFLEVGDAVKRGVFVINPGLKAMKADALGIDVKIRTEGVPDIRWRDEAAVVRAGGMVGAAGEVKAGVMTELKTDAGGVGRAELAAGGDGAVVVAYAVDGTSLMAADVLVIPSKAKLRVRAVVPDEVTPGQEFAMPVVVTNLSGETTAATAATVMTGGVASQAEIPAIEPGRTVVVRAHATCPLAWEGGAAIPVGVPGWGAVAGVGRGQRPVTVTLGGVEWRGVLRTRTLKVPVVVPVGGMFGQGEHVLTLPAGEGAVGVRIVKAADLASFPGASLDAGGELHDASEPQHPASALLHVLAARAGATDETVKRALDGRMALLTAELAVTESEGGWSWENIGISPGLLTTAFTWRALLEAKAAGTVVSDMMLKRTAAFVAGRYRGIGATDFERKATTLQSLAAAGQADFSVLNPLYRARETLTPVALSRLCAAFIHAEREDEAKEVLVQLLKTGTAGKTAAGEETLFWPGAKTVAGLNAPEEATAAALWCVARLNPGAPEARRIAMWLINAAASAPGGTTRCRGQVMQALAEYAKALPRAAAGDRVEVLSGGQAVEVMPGMLLPMPADGRLVIRVSGAAPAVVIAAVEREVAPDDPKTWEYPKIGGRLYLHDNFVTDGIRLGAAGSSPVTQAAYGQLVHVVVKVSNHPDPTWQSHGNFLQIDEEIPAGCLLVEGSLRHNADRVERSGNRLRLRYGPGTIQDISYDVIALMPGVWPVRAAEIADPYDPARCRRGVAGSLTVLAPGVASPDAYQMNRAEHLELARLRFAQNKGVECLGHLDALAGGKLSQDEERDMARMRLWILADAADGDARAMIGAFELLSERHPRLVIPFDKLLKVGPAYRKLGEFERAATVFRAALDGAFLEDAGLAVVLEDNGDFAGSVAFQEVLWSRYPDSRDVMDSLSGLAQSLSTRASEAEKLPVRRGQPKLEKVGLLGRSLGLLQRYATLYPEDEQADDVAFSMVNVHFALKDYPGMVAAATAGAERHAGGGFADSFKYMAALGYFWQGAFDKALAAAAPVANGESKDRDYARYVTAQVHHAQGQPALAIEWYSKVKGVYEDAAEAIALFEEKRVTLPEVTVFKPGEPVKLTLDYRNIREGAVQLYKVDLMKLYLREKSLSSITRVNLAGIAPEAGESFALGDGKDFAVKQKVLTLPVKEEGAYLAIVRGDNLFTSGLVLVSALKLEVKENSSGTVRVTVTDAAGGKAVSDADVKALGSQSMVVQSGSTDPRGVFETGGIAGTATVIVKQGESRYAFHRGNTVIGGEFDPPQILQNFGGDAPARNNAGLEQRASGKPKVMSKGDYLKNIDDSNKALQKQQIDNWEEKRRSNAKGVEASEALKK